MMLMYEGIPQHKFAVAEILLLIRLGAPRPSIAHEMLS